MWITRSLSDGFKTAPQRGNEGAGPQSLPLDQRFAGHFLGLVHSQKVQERR